jgi:CheY-like chemotaxis protein
MRARWHTCCIFCPGWRPNIQVLIAEDDPHVRGLVRDVITDLGHSTACVASGDEALSYYAEHGADVVVSDWMMPGLDGVELCQRMRAHIGAPYTYFILLTALGDTEHRLAGIQAGADDYVAKPFTIEDIEAPLLTAERVTLEHRRQEALLRMTRRFAAEADPMRLVDELLHEAIKLVGGSAGVVTRWDEEHRGLETVAASAPLLDPLLVQTDLGSAIVVPLLHEARLVGTLSVGGSANFTRDHAELLELLGSTAVAALLALEHARLDGVRLAARTAQHELNNQLAVARGYAEVLVGAPDLPAHLHEFAEEVMSAADDAAGIVRQLRNVSSIHEQYWSDQGDTTINLARSQHRGAA